MRKSITILTVMAFVPIVTPVRKRQPMKRQTKVLLALLVVLFTIGILITVAGPIAGDELNQVVLNDTGGYGFIDTE